jgi:hypothetical protein
VSAPESSTDLIADGPAPAHRAGPYRDTAGTLRVVDADGALALLRAILGRRNEL